MQYANVVQATFLDRPNRFIAICRLEGGEEVRTHVKNTGRCRELLVPGCTVFLAQAESSARKTAYDLIAVYKGDLLINLDSQAPNRAAAEFLPGYYPGSTFFRAEYRYRNSRFDFYLERPGERRLIEVKGVTLEEQGATYFPDAPTVRGLRHIEELTEARREGYEATLLLVIQMKGVKSFAPNDRTQPALREALRAAQAAGVEILAYDCIVTPDAMTIADPVEIIL